MSTNIADTKSNLMNVKNDNKDLNANVSSPKINDTTSDNSQVVQRTNVLEGSDVPGSSKTPFQVKEIGSDNSQPIPNKQNVPLTKSQIKKNKKNMYKKQKPKQPAPKPQPNITRVLVSPEPKFSDTHESIQIEEKVSEYLSTSLDEMKSECSISTNVTNDEVEEEIIIQTHENKVNDILTTNEKDHYRSLTSLSFLKSFDQKFSITDANCKVIGGHPPHGPFSLRINPFKSADPFCSILEGPHTSNINQNQSVSFAYKVLSNGQAKNLFAELEFIQFYDVKSILIAGCLTGEHYHYLVKAYPDVKFFFVDEKNLTPLSTLLKSFPNCYFLQAHLHEEYDIRSRIFKNYTLNANFSCDSEYFWDDMRFDDVEQELNDILWKKQFALFNGFKYMSLKIILNENIVYYLPKDTVFRSQIFTNPYSMESRVYIRLGQNDSFAFSGQALLGYLDYYYSNNRTVDREFSHAQHLLSCCPNPSIYCCDFNLVINLPTHFLKIKTAKAHFEEVKFRVNTLDVDQLQEYKSLLYIDDVCPSNAHVQDAFQRWLAIRYICAQLLVSPFRRPLLYMSSAREIEAFHSFLGDAFVLSYCVGQYTAGDILRDVETYLDRPDVFIAIDVYLDGIIGNKDVLFDSKQIIKRMLSYHLNDSYIVYQNFSGLMGTTLGGGKWIRNQFNNRRISFQQDSTGSNTYTHEIDEEMSHDHVVRYENSNYGFTLKRSFRQYNLWRIGLTHALPTAPIKDLEGVGFMYKKGLQYTFIKGMMSFGHIFENVGDTVAYDVALTEEYLSFIKSTSTHQIVTHSAEFLTKQVLKFSFKEKALNSFAVFYIANSFQKALDIFNSTNMLAGSISEDIYYALMIRRIGQNVISEPLTMKHRFYLFFYGIIQFFKEKVLTRGTNNIITYHQYQWICLSLGLEKMSTIMSEFFFTVYFVPLLEECIKTVSLSLITAVAFTLGCPPLIALSTGFSAYTLVHMIFAYLDKNNGSGNSKLQYLYNLFPPGLSLALHMFLNYLDFVAVPQQFIYGTELVNHDKNHITYYQAPRILERWTIGTFVDNGLSKDYNVEVTGSSTPEEFALEHQVIINDKIFIQGEPKQYLDEPDFKDPNSLRPISFTMFSFNRVGVQAYSDWPTLQSVVYNRILRPFPGNLDMMERSWNQAYLLFLQFKNNSNMYFNLRSSEHMRCTDAFYCDLVTQNVNWVDRLHVYKENVATRKFSKYLKTYEQMKLEGFNDVGYRKVHKRELMIKRDEAVMSDPAKFRVICNDSQEIYLNTIADVHLVTMRMKAMCHLINSISLRDVNGTLWHFHLVFAVGNKEYDNAFIYDYASNLAADHIVIFCQGDDSNVISKNFNYELDATNYDWSLRKHALKFEKKVMGTLGASYHTIQVLRYADKLPWEARYDKGQDILQRWQIDMRDNPQRATGSSITCSGNTTCALFSCLYALHRDPRDVDSIVKRYSELGITIKVRQHKDMFQVPFLKCLCTRIEPVFGKVTFYDDPLDIQYIMVPLPSRYMKLGKKLDIVVTNNNMHSKLCEAFKDALMSFVCFRNHPLFDPLFRKYIPRQYLNRIEIYKTDVKSDMQQKFSNQFIYKFDELSVLSQLASHYDVTVDDVLQFIAQVKDVFSRCDSYHVPYFHMVTPFSDAFSKLDY